MMNEQAWIDEIQKWSYKVECLEADNEQLRAALEAGCEYHHLPLIPEGSPDAWAHMVANKTIRCRLSKQARQALAASLPAEEASE